MKARIVLITYLNNGSMKSQVAKEYLFNKIVNSLIEEGREITHTEVRPMDKRAIFADGTKVICVPFSMNHRGMKATNIYVDSELLTVPNGKQAVTETFATSLLIGEYEKYDTSGGHRLNTFEFINNEILLSPLF